jgi:hypothetical protein
MFPRLNGPFCPKESIENMNVFGTLGSMNRKSPLKGVPSGKTLIQGWAEIQLFDLPRTNALK